MPSLAFIQGTGYCPMCGAMGGWGMSLMALFWIAVLALLVWGAVWLVQRSSRRSTHWDEILRERYARGEIDQETYERMRRDLEA